MNYGLGFWFWVWILVLGLTAASADNTNDPRYEKRASRNGFDFTLPVAQNEIKIMAYNVENLFDADHDDGKNDWEFLPIKSPLKKNCAGQGSYEKKCYNTDWTAQRLQIKLKQIKKAVLAQGSLPDMLGLEEVENARVVQMLAKELGYDRFVITSSPDVRGIDVALLFNEDKIKYLDHAEHEIKAGNMKTRNLLVVNFSFKASPTQTVGIYVNHWPSQASSAKSRVEAAKNLKSFVDEQSGRYASYHAVLMGDFNTIDSDIPHPFHEVITNSNWKMGFYDVNLLFDAMKAKEKTSLPPGTYFYGGEGVWNRLDHFFVSRSLVDTKDVEIVPDSFRIVAPEFITRAFEYSSRAHHLYSSVMFGVPFSYNHNSSDEATAGYSDHFPIVMKLKIN